VFGDPAARGERLRPATRDRGARSRGAAVDIAISKPRSRAGRSDAFMSAASPGVVSLFFRNDYYKDHETYLFAIADAMRHEYEASRCRIVLQIDCLISPWAAHPVCGS